MTLGQTSENMTLGQAIRRARIDNALTLQELSTMCGISITSLSQIELDRQKPYLASIKKICKALNISHLEIVRKYY